MRGRAAGVLWGLLLGCGYPTYQYVDEAAVPDVGTIVTDTGVEPPRDGCIENGCGGCNAPSDENVGIKGQRCEPCGQWTCSGTSVVCTPAMPAPGSACGMCGTQKLTCTSLGTTSCPMDDDRLVYDDAKFESKNDKVWVVDRANEAVIAFKSVRAISYFETAVVLRRVPYSCARVNALPHPDPACSDCSAASGGGFDCTVPAPTVGEIALTLYAGSPSTGLTPLTTSTITAASIATSAGWVTFTLSSPVSPRPVGTPLAIGLTTDSSGHAFEVYGGGSSSFPPAANDTVFWHRSTKPSGPWVEEPSNDLAHVLRGKACAP